MYRAKDFHRMLVHGRILRANDFHRMPVTIQAFINTACAW
jgi:hypothetical protein